MATQRSRKRPSKPNKTAARTVAVGGGVWKPRIHSLQQFNPFSQVESPAHTPGAISVFETANTATIRDSAVDTAPLQGSRDISDEDSLTDVIAASYAARPSAKPSKATRARLAKGAQRSTTITRK